MLITTVFLVTFLFDPYRKIPNKVLSYMARAMMHASPGWKKEIKGIQNYTAGEPTVFVANHQSFLDMALIFTLPWQMKWVTKRSLMMIPVMGWLAWFTGHLAIDRKKSREAIKKLDNLIPPLKDNIPVMIFPEGTRSKDGELKSFKNGAFLLALENGFKIQPVVIDGGFRALKSGGKTFAANVNFKLSVLETVDTSAFSDLKTLKEHVRRLMGKELELMRAS